MGENPFKPPKVPPSALFFPQIFGWWHFSPSGFGFRHFPTLGRQQFPFFGPVSPNIPGVIGWELLCATFPNQFFGQGLGTGQFRAVLHSPPPSTSRGVVTPGGPFFPTHGCGERGPPSYTVKARRLDNGVIGQPQRQ